MSFRQNPCPRCGSGSVKIVARRGHYYGHCLACVLSGEERPTSAAALDAWNSAAETARATSEAAEGKA